MINKNNKNNNIMLRHKKVNHKGELKFQIIDWAFGDTFEIENDSESETESESDWIEPNKKSFEIRVYGVNEEGYSVSGQISGFNPFFYVRMPKKHISLNTFKRVLKSNVKPCFRTCLIDIEYILMKDFYWYNDKEKFAKITLKNMIGFYVFRKLFKGPIKIQKKHYNFKLFESKLPQVLRLIHIKNISACGWIKLKKYKINKPKITRCQIDFKTDYKNIIPLDDNKISKILIASFDIECTSEDGSFPVPTKPNDKIIQIGVTFHYMGEEKCCYKYIASLGTCDKFAKDVKVDCYDDERKLLIGWAKFMNKMDPDIITGYNIDFFDYSYIYERSKYLNCWSNVNIMGRMLHKQDDFKDSSLSSSGLGANIKKLIIMEGRVSIDLYYIAKTGGYGLSSYKLDNVSSEFIIGKVLGVKDNVIKTDSTLGILEDNYIQFWKKEIHGKDKYNDGEKFKIIKIGKNFIELDKIPHITTKYCWGLAKDDISVSQIFGCYKGSSKDRALIAKYCVQDCVLCNKLIMKLKVIENNIGMSNVCSVPLSYLFTRGQGIKIQSLFTKFCNENGYLIPTLEKNNEENNSGYEGAIVFKPKAGVYTKTPIAVLDYASLYPSSMIAENISPDTLISIKDYTIKPITKSKDKYSTLTNKKINDNGIKYEESGSLFKAVNVVKDKLIRYKCREGDFNEEKENRYDNLEGYHYNDIEYGIFTFIDPSNPNKGKIQTGIRVCRYIESDDMSKGITPNIENKLLSSRKFTRSKIKYKTIEYNNKTISGLVKDKGEYYLVNDEKINKEDITKIYDTYNDFEKAVFDGLQKAYKVTCNSIYGQYGAETSAISFKDIAASTTAVGRMMVILARDRVCKMYKGVKLVYGDTDSVFLNYMDYIEKRHGKNLSDEDKLRYTLKYAQESSEKVNKTFKHPQNLEYEKIFFPFCIFSKKRYVGNKYEFDITKYKQTSMGIVLKRRDNAKILKKIYGRIIDIILNERDVEGSIKYFKNAVRDLLDGNVDINDLIINKTLNSNYSDPTKIAHKVLADRIGDRNPGNRPQVGDRIDFCYIDKKELKCDKCNGNIKYTKCKCNYCLGKYCLVHLKGHKCDKKCRFCRKKYVNGDNIKKCETCNGLFCKDCMIKHDIVKDRYGNINTHKHKCKHKLKEKLLQGDLLEDPKYIAENKIKLDYKYYLDHQIKKPVLQIFENVVDNHLQILDDVERDYFNKENGNNTITNYFKSTVKFESRDWMNKDIKEIDMKKINKTIKNRKRNKINLRKNYPPKDNPENFKTGFEKVSKIDNRKYVIVGKRVKKWKRVTEKN